MVSMTFDADAGSPRGGLRRATIRDVARHAGVSHQTVSRYLRHSGEGVREEIRERIRQAVVALDYRPNLAARAMRTARTGQLAVLLPAGPAHSVVEVMAGITVGAREAGYAVDTLTLSGSPEDRASRALDLLESGLFEGILSLTPLRIVASPGRRIVEYELYDDEMHGVGPLADGSPIEEMMGRLVEWGHHRFLHLAGSFTHESARRRRDAFVGAAAALGVSGEVVECGWSAERARDAVAGLPRSAKPDAIVAANDTLAAAAIRGAASQGWRVPDDLSVTGFDSPPIAAWLSPSLTSVVIDHEELGRRALARWLAVVKGQETPPAGPTVMRVAWRESTRSALA